MKMSSRLRSAAVSLACTVLCNPVLARASDLADLSLEQLAQVVVTSASRRQEPLAGVSASMFVITADDIRRSGATSLPEVLRLAPNLDVARHDSSQYAISARGFNNLLANRMLVMIDGRTLYTPLFSGVLWEAQDLMIEDIERIEVMSGPSAAQWGTNAVNGVIHILTRNARETQGQLATAYAGHQGSGVAARHGGQWHENGWYRVYAKAYERADSEVDGGARAHDAAQGVQAGFRATWEDGARTMTLQGDAYRASLDQQPGSREISGAHLLGRWRLGLGDGSHLLARLYLERTQRDQPVLSPLPDDAFEETLDTVDAVVQYALRPAGAHELLFGGGLRHVRDQVDNPTTFAFVPTARNMTWSRFFAQDQITLAPALTLTLAASVERNPYDGTDLLPSARLAWRTSDRTLWWAALSRAARAPSRIDRDYRQPAQPPYRFLGGPEFRSELSDSLELGRRAQVGRDIGYSVTGFVHRHQRLRSITPTPVGALLENHLEGYTRGAEAWAHWQAARGWKVSGGGVVLRQRLRVSEGATDQGGLAALGNDPRHWWSLRSSYDLRRDLYWEVALRRTGARPQPAVSAYTALDTRLAWRPAAGVEVGLSVLNLLGAEHVEWRSSSGAANEWDRAATLMVRWQL
ncbi:iron complex outermembrane recepter protein [Caldimonas brevitalea]|uniref:Iron complex outermembrane recepter protein n=2 Tax=Caldimonas brevitalea TaxID=413882 RepID=A0A0G3BIP6_9BURK|nr:iron complex outermembrane recepter protein [Caldimonas brevitalea]